jgi:ABC-type polysaccharide/polyol phosphate transport system ATPase subunit
VSRPEPKVKTFVAPPVGSAGARAREAFAKAIGTTPAALLITEECKALEEMLLEKNRRYGNSALDPVRIFSRADSVEQIKVRIDDKLSRLARGEGSEDEDVERDLLGYFVLLRVARRLAAEVARG